MRQDSYMLVNRQKCRRGDRNTWRRIGHLDGLRDNQLRTGDEVRRIGKVVQENRGKRKKRRVLYQPDVV